MAALNQDESPNSADKPAPRDSVIALYLTGEGLATPPLADGELPSPARSPKPVLPVTVTIAGLPAEVLSVAAAPGVPGVMEVKVRVPQEAPAGAAVAVAVTVGQSSSQPATTIALQ